MRNYRFDSWWDWGLNNLERLVLVWQWVDKVHSEQNRKIKESSTSRSRRQQAKGHIPNYLCQMSNLGDLSLSNNSLNGSIPPCFDEILIYLDSNNLGSNIPPSFWNLDGLLRLNLSSNNFSGTIPFEIRNFKSVLLLDLSWNLFSFDVPMSISEAESIINLSLAWNHWTFHITTCQELYRIH